MTYSAGSLIQSTDYNGFVSTTAGANINATWNTAYGQTALSTVAAAATISALQWSTLNTTINSMASHQGTTVTSRSNPTAGTIISVLANVNTDITNCYTNRNNAASVGTQYTAWTGTTSKTTPTGVAGPRPTPWTITFTNTMTFANATAASSFFNSGGLVKTQFSKTSTGTVADTEWNSFISTVCASSVYLSGAAASKTIAATTYTGTTKFGGTGTPTTIATGTGFFNLTTTPTILYKQFDSGAAYSSNYVQITGNVDANASPTILTLVTTWYDNGDNNPGSTPQISGGTSGTGITFGTAPTTVVTYFPPEQTYLSPVWGTPSVASTVV